MTRANIPKNELNRDEQADEVVRRNVEQSQELLTRKHEQEQQRAEAAADNVLPEDERDPGTEDALPGQDRDVPALGGTYGIRNQGGGTSYPTGSS